MRPDSSCNLPRLPMTVPRSGTATISPKAVTRFCLGIVTLTSLHRTSLRPLPTHVCRSAAITPLWLRHLSPPRRSTIFFGLMSNRRPIAVFPSGIPVARTDREGRSRRGYPDEAGLRRFEKTRGVPRRRRAHERPDEPMRVTVLTRGLLLAIPATVSPHRWPSTDGEGRNRRKRPGSRR